MLRFRITASWGARMLSRWNIGVAFILECVSPRCLSISNRATQDGCSFEYVDRELSYPCKLFAFFEVIVAI